MSEPTMNDRDQDRLVLLDRIAERVPELDLDRERVQWRTLPDGHEALFVNLDAATGDGDGAYFANHGDDTVGSLAPLIEERSG